MVELDSGQEHNRLDLGQVAWYNQIWDKWHNKIRFGTSSIVELNSKQVVQ